MFKYELVRNRHDIDWLATELSLRGEKGWRVVHLVMEGNAIVGALVELRYTVDDLKYGRVDAGSRK